MTVSHRVGLPSASDERDHLLEGAQPLVGDRQLALPLVAAEVGAQAVADREKWASCASPAG